MITLPHFRGGDLDIKVISGVSKSEQSYHTSGFSLKKTQEGGLYVESVPMKFLFCVGDSLVDLGPVTHFLLSLPHRVMMTE